MGGATTVESAIGIDRRLTREDNDPVERSEDLPADR
jgi:hypothetical protein